MDTDSSQNEKKEKSEKKNLWILVLDKLVIAAIIIGLTYYLDGRNATNQTLLNALLQKKADSTRADHEIYLQLLKKQLENAQLEIQAQNDSLLESFRQERNLQNQLALLERNFANEQINIQKLFRNDTILLRKGVTAANDKETYKARLEFVTSQLRDFYWPIKIRLEKNNALYRLLGNSFVSDRIDSEVILPNHLETIAIIEKKIHLAQADDTLSFEISNYIGHVYMYQALRRGGYDGFPDDYAGNDYRDSFYKIISDRTLRFQMDYDELIKKVYQDSVTTKTLNDTINSKKGAIQFFSGQDSISFNYKQEKFELKLAFNNQSFVKPLPDTVMIAFKKYIKDADFCVFHIGKYNQDANGKSFRKDADKKLLIEEFRLEEGRSYTYKSLGRNFKIYLDKIWQEGRRTKVSLEVESWKRN